MVFELSSPTIFLASASPRRRQLLAFTGWQVEVHPVGADESPLPGEPPEALVRRLALAKAEALAAEGEAEVVVVAADTVVVDGDRVIGKPANAEDARQILMGLRGRHHRVLTALVLVDQRLGRQYTEVCESLVPMREYSPEEVEAYVASGSPLDKAGAYGIQDLEFHPVALQEISGCFANVMGLPLCRLVHTMRSLGYEPPVDVTAGCATDPGYGDCVVPSLLTERA